MNPEDSEAVETTDDSTDDTVDQSTADATESVEGDAAGIADEAPDDKSEDAGTAVDPDVDGGATEPVADLDDEEGDPAVDAADVQADPPARRPVASAALAFAVAALLAAIVCLGYFGYSGVRAYTIDSARDEVRTGAVDGAEQAILNTMSIDPNRMDEWQKRVASSLTGDALSQMKEQSSQTVIEQVQNQKNDAPKLSVRIVRSSATEVDADDETAKVLVFSESSASNAPNDVKGLSYLLTMVKSDGVWKASVIVPLEDIEYDQDSATPVPAPQGAEQGGGN